MIFTNPTAPNPNDFLTFVYAQGVPQGDFPSGSLSGVSVNTSGNILAAGSSGTVVAGMSLYGTGFPPWLSLLTWNATNLTGTVIPIPSQSVQGISSVSVFMPSLLRAFFYANDRTFGSSIIPGDQYTLAVYNLGMHQLLKIGSDQSSQTWFSDARTQYKLLSFTGGVVQTATDQNTSSTVAVPELLKNLSMSNLDLLKTPWGREYLGYAMNFGPYIVGMS